MRKIGRKLVQIDALTEHPQNTFYFDRMEETKWDDFKESIRLNGLFVDPIVTSDGVIVAGRERTRACSELGITECYADIRDYESDDELLLCLIETNIQQRGTIGGSPIKAARRIQALERLYGVVWGKNQYMKTGGETVSPPRTQEDIAKELGVTPRNMQMLKSLLALPQEFQDMVGEGRITQSTALRVIKNLTDKEKTELLKQLSEEDATAKKFTESQIQEYVDAMRRLEEKVKDFQQLSSNDNADYLRLVDEKDTIKEEAVRAINDLTLVKRQVKTMEKELATAQKQSEGYETLKDSFDDAKSEIDRLRKHGTTSSQIISSLCGFQTVINGISCAETVGCATQKEVDKINDLVEKIRSGLTKIVLMVGCVSNERVG